MLKFKKQNKTQQNYYNQLTPQEQRHKDLESEVTRSSIISQFKV